MGRTRHTALLGQRRYLAGLVSLVLAMIVLLALGVAGLAAALLLRAA